MASVKAPPILVFALVALFLYWVVQDPVGAAAQGLRALYAAIEKRAAQGDLSRRAACITGEHTGVPVGQMQGQLAVTETRRQG